MGMRWEQGMGTEVILVVVKSIWPYSGNKLFINRPLNSSPVPSLLPCLFLSLLPSLFPFLRNRKNQTNGFVMRFFEEGTNPDGNKYLLFIKDIYRNGYIGERDVCSLVPIPCSHSAWKQHELSARPTCRAAPENAADPVPPPPIPLGQGAGGSKGARPPSPEVQEPGGSW